jgi:hypothetical protein
MHRTIRVGYKSCWLVACCSLVFGCTGDTKNGTVSGTVTLDGEPLAKGVIQFVPADGRTASAQAIIEDGKFSAKVPIGEKRISISASKVVGKRKMYDTPDSPMVDKVEELLPAQYNSASKLTLNVTAGTQEPTYDLKSGK